MAFARQIKRNTLWVWVICKQFEFIACSCIYGYYQIHDSQRTHSAAESKRIALCVGFEYLRVLSISCCWIYGLLWTNWSLFLVVRGGFYKSHTPTQIDLILRGFPDDVPIHVLCFHQLSHRNLLQYNDSLRGYKILLAQQPFTILQGTRKWKETFLWWCKLGKNSSVFSDPIERDDKTRERSFLSTRQKRNDEWGILFSA